MSSKGGKDSVPTKILISLEAKQKMERLVLHCPDEVYWFGLVDRVKIGEKKLYLRIYDILVPRQKVTGSSVEMDGTMNEVCEELIAAGRADEIEKIRAFCHSHVNMNVYHSSTDLEMLFDLGEKLEAEWFISLVTNKRGEYDVRWDQFDPFRMHVNQADLIDIVPSAIDKWAREQLADKVEKVVYQSSGMGFTRQGTGTSSGSAGGSGKYYSIATSVFEARSRYPWADCIEMHLVDGRKKVVCDGWIMEEQILAGGQTEFFQAPSEKDLKASQESSSRSLKRSVDKRKEDEGKGEVATVSRLPSTNQDGRHQTRPASDHRRSFERSENGKPQELTLAEIAARLTRQDPTDNWDEGEALLFLIHLDNNREDEWVEDLLKTLGMTLDDMHQVLEAANVLIDDEDDDLVAQTEVIEGTYEDMGAVVDVLNE